MKYLSPAKINLFLETLGKYEDGYHDIRSVMCGISLYDEIFIEENSKLDISFNGEFGHQVENNNIENLFNFLKKENLINTEAYSIRIKKNIPVGAGLGGGSSNIATVLNHLESKKLFDSQKKISISRKLGSDIEFFLENKPAYIVGRGVVQKTMEFQLGQFLLIIFPNKPLSTKAVYEINTTMNNDFVMNDLKTHNFLNLIKERNNCLEEAAMTLCPDIKIILDAINSYPECILGKMSGSGSSCFAVFNNKNEAIKVQDDLKNKHPDWWTCFAKTI